MPAQLLEVSSVIGSLLPPSPSSLAFFLCVLVVLTLYYTVAKTAQIQLLLVASYLFCAAWNPSFALVILVSSVVNHRVALNLDRSPSNSRRYWLWTGLFLNLSALFVFKYLGQATRYLGEAVTAFAPAATSVEVTVLQPIGISFYTLQAVSYLVDVYWTQLPASTSFVEVSLYLAYFPKLLAGPIERASQFFEQLRSRNLIGNPTIGVGLTRILTGLLRKRAIADPLSVWIPADVLRHPLSYAAPDLIFWWLAYAFVIYNDFAGYTSIARGVSELFGIHLSPNFEQPFFSTGFVDFWNRWHISLSRWLRDYIYLPTSRALLRRHPGGRYLPNLVLPPLLTMVVSGIWHGGSPHLILWGLLNGALQGIERVFRSRQKLGGGPSPAWRRLVAIPATLLAMLLISVPFRLEIPETLMFWHGLLNWKPPQTLAFPAMIEPILAIGLSFFLDAVVLPARDETGWLKRSHAVRVFAVAVGLLVLFLATRRQTPTPFIYQNF